MILSLKGIPLTLGNDSSIPYPNPRSLVPFATSVMAAVHRTGAALKAAAESSPVPTWERWPIWSDENNFGGGVSASWTSPAPSVSFMLGESFQVHRRKWSVSDSASVRQCCTPVRAVAVNLFTGELLVIGEVCLPVKFGQWCPLVTGMVTSDVWSPGGHRWSWSPMKFGYQWRFGHWCTLVTREVTGEVWSPVHSGHRCTLVTSEVTGEVGHR